MWNLNDKKKHLIFSTIRNIMNKGLSPVSSLFDYHKLETKIPINCRRRVILKRMFRDYFFSHIEFNLFINFPFGTTQYSRNVEPFCNSEDFKSNYGLSKTLPLFPYALLCHLYYWPPPIAWLFLTVSEDMGSYFPLTLPSSQETSASLSMTPFLTSPCQQLLPPFSLPSSWPQRGASHFTSEVLSDHNLLSCQLSPPSLQIYSGTSLGSWVLRLRPVY